MNNTCFTGNIEIDGKCPLCKSEPIVIYPHCNWIVEITNYDGDLTDVIVTEEITAHFCSNCEIITSLSFNKF